jgi:hypothetical protein
VSSQRRAFSSPVSELNQRYQFLSRAGMGDR